MLCRRASVTLAADSMCHVFPLTLTMVRPFFDPAMNQAAMK